MWPVEEARSGGAPAMVVNAAAAKLAELENEIAAFIKHRRTDKQLLPPPQRGWVSAGRHIWYDESEELGRGSLAGAYTRPLFSST